MINVYVYVYRTIRSSKEILLKLYNVMAASTFLYGCNNWNLIKQEGEKIKETQMKAVRPVVRGNKT